MLGSYESSESEPEAAAGGDAGLQAAVMASGEEAVASSEESDQDGVVDVVRLPSATAAFASVDEDDLGFKKFAAAKAKERRVRAHTMSLDRITAASVATLRGQGWQPSQAATDAALPLAVAETFRQATEMNDATSVKRNVEDGVGEGNADADKGNGGKGKGKMTVKERTKLKRFKGQSGEDHSGRVWKPEVWMQMRAQFD